MSGTDIPRDVREAEERFRFETLLTEFSARFVNVPADRVDAEIEDAQRRVCECLGIDLSALWQWDAENPGNLVLTHLYRPLGGPPVPERMDASDHFPWSLRQIAAGKVIVISSMENVPEGASRDLESWRLFGIITTLTIPLSAGGSPPFGTISFNDMRAERTWSEVLIKRLELVAQIFANAIVRTHIEQALRESEERLTMALDASGVGAWSMDVRSRRIWASASERNLFGFPADGPLTYDRFLDMINPDDRESVRAAIEKVLRTKAPLFVEYRITRADGSVRWIAARGRPRCDAKGEPDRLLGISVDVTQRKRTEGDLRNALDEVKKLRDHLHCHALYPLPAESDMREIRFAQCVAPKVLQSERQWMPITGHLRRHVRSTCASLPAPWMVPSSCSVP